MIKQLKPGNGMDLSRVTLPTFILEPRSLLERFTDFLTHAQYIISIHAEADPLQRFLSVVRWFISGYHIRPTGVKKPYNPILGECCRAEWDHGEHGRTLFVAEQTSHHPRVSAFYFVNPRCNLVVEGDVKPKSRFLLNSVASLMEGSMSIRLLNLDEEYVITFPSYYVRGLFLGTLKMELSGKGTITCASTGLSCELEFKNKGMFGRGSNNAVVGEVLQKKKCVATIEGNWDSVVRWGLGSKADRVLLDVSPSASPVSQKIIAPLSQQLQHESRRLWSRVPEAIRARDMDTATAHKVRTHCLCSRCSLLIMCTWRRSWLWKILSVKAEGSEKQRGKFGSQPCFVTMGGETIDFG